MLLQTLLDPEIQKYIHANSDGDIVKLALQKNPFPSVDFKLILNQIESRSKSKTKLPTWFATNNLLYPSKTSVEQTSSEVTAKYKSELIQGHTLLDATGGFGIDDYYFSKTFRKVIHCEINEVLSKIVAHNAKLLDATNIECHFGDSQIILKALQQPLDWIYLDPSRRNDAKGKVFMLEDCLPNVPDLLDFYLTFSNNILIKTAPILDITAGLKALKNVYAVHIIAVENEVKELLWEIRKESNAPLKYKTVNIQKTQNDFFEFEPNEALGDMNYALPQKYLYEPNSALMKSGGFSNLAKAFHVEKLHPHSHLFTSYDKQKFPGRRFEIKTIFPYSKKLMNEHVQAQKANVTVRNFPESVEEIRKKWKIKEGGEQFYFFTTDKNNNKIVLLCKKI